MNVKELWISVLVMVKTLCRVLGIMMSAPSTIRGRMFCKNNKKASVVFQPSVSKSMFEKDDVSINVMRRELSEISQVASAISNIDSEIKKLFESFI